MTAVPSPRRYLQHLHGYLTEHLGSDSFLRGRGELDQLHGDDERWSDAAALMDAEKSVAGSTEAAALRAIADDLSTVLYAEALRLVAGSSLADWHRAEMYGKTTLGLLRYHARASDRGSQAARASRPLAVRDALMAQNLLDICTREQHRGATLVVAHNRHLQRHRSTWRLADMDLEWFSVGAIVATLRGDGYAFIAGSLGASATLGLHAPPADTFEDAIAEATRGSALVDAARLDPALSRDVSYLRSGPTSRPSRGTSR